MKIVWVGTAYGWWWFEHSTSSTIYPQGVPEWTTSFPKHHGIRWLSEPDLSSVKKREWRCAS